MVPGNHDIDWTYSEGVISTQFREAMRDCSLDDLDSTLRTRLLKDQMGDALLRPLDNYNAFAQQWACLSSTSSLSWTDTTLEVDGWTISLCGVNSVLASDRDDSDTIDRCKQLVGSLQCRLARADDTVHIVICHHPPSWLRDWALVEPYFDRAHVQLFGHEHVYKAAQICDRGPVRVFAGAVGPQPKEPCKPTYNLLELAVTGDTLEVGIHPRVWRPEQTTFGAHGVALQHFSVALELPPMEAATTSDILAPAQVALAGTPSDSGIDADQSTATPLMPQDTSRKPLSTHDGRTPEDLRRLSYKYLSSSRTRRMDIATRLGVIEDSELEIARPAETFFIDILSRIRDRGLIDNLAKELDDG
jgi:hypothetical protein